MDTLVPRAMAIILSVTAVVFFSEIIPQAICLKYPLELAGFFSWLMIVLVAVFYPIASPIALLLDFAFGKHHESILTRGGYVIIYKNNEILNIYIYFFFFKKNAS